METQPRLEVSQEAIVGDLRKLGVKKGDILTVHSSLKSIGYVIGGPETVIEALLEVLGADGTLLMPTFSAELKTSFNPEKTPSNVGLITETFWKREDVLRSSQPTHSVAAWGKHAQEFIKDHTEHSSALGVGSPLHKAATQGGVVLLLGAPFSSLSLGHVAEILAGVPYVNVPAYGIVSSKIETPGGKERTVYFWKEFPGCGSGFRKLEPLLQEKNLLKVGSIGMAKSYLMKGEDVLKVMIEKMKEYPLYFLCDSQECQVCNERRRFMKKVLWKNN